MGSQCFDGHCSHDVPSLAHEATLNSPLGFRREVWMNQAAEFEGLMNLFAIA